MAAGPDCRSEAVSDQREEPQPRPRRQGSARDSPGLRRQPTVTYFQMGEETMSTATNVTQPAAPNSAHVQEVIVAAERELQQLLHQRSETMKRIGTVKQTLVCLAKVFGEDILTPEVTRLLGRGPTRKQPGFTRACRVVLMEASSPLEARQGFRELQRRFPDLVERHKDPLASVTTVFNRLGGDGEGGSFFNGKGGGVWEWIAEPANDTALLSAGDSLPVHSSITKQ